MTGTLHLVRLVLDRRALLRVATRHHLGQGADEGALLHAGLSQLFATSEERAEVPLHNFAGDDMQAERAQDPTATYVLAYAEHDAAGLRERMGPSRGELLRECFSRAMPTFEAGQRLGFRARVCPTVRTHKPGDRPLGVDRRGKVKGREIDAFVHAALTVGQGERVDREVVYARWLQRELARDGAARCETGAVRLAAFQREQVRRGGNGRMERPDALLEGELAVADPKAFHALLARGLGRHRAFGYGMLLLRAPSR